ncbi:MAG: hypothetical protein ABIY70_10290 [Capsulimonas sp.]|uniref:hypothetical protein n=1 Tax=Capsulimonas sp. TaxID=2494211 RepID=UPI003266597D
MKTEARLSVFDTGDISPDAYNHISETFPQYIRYSTLDFELPFEHPDLQRALRMLEEAGATPVGSLYPRSGEKFRLYITRTYEDADLDAARFLIPRHLYDVTFKVDMQGKPVMLVDAAFWRKPGNDYAGANVNNILVSETVTEKIHDLGMLGIEMHPVIVKGGPRLGVKKYWRLTSDIVMPPLSPSMIMLDENGEPYNGDPARECYLRDSRSLPGAMIADAEFHYRKEDVEGMDFDLAYTQEKLFSRSVPYPVVSQKFYQMAKSLNLAIAWKPVRLD